MAVVRGNDGEKKKMTGPEHEWREKALERAQQEPDREPAKFELKPGMRLVVQGTAYKVVAVRPNGKVTLRQE